LALVFAQAFHQARLKSPTFDEPAHIGAGFSYLKTGTFKVNQQHPPLLKEIAALPLVLIDAHWPMTEEAWATIPNLPEPWFQWSLGQEVIFRNDPERVLFFTRMPFVLMATGLGALLYLWGRRLIGGAPAVAALGLYALDPTIIAHAPLVTTDVGFAAFGMLFLFALWSYLNHRTLQRLLWCGLALGAALGAKFSALILIPTAFILLCGAIAWLPESIPIRRSTIIDPYAGTPKGRRLLWSIYALGAMAALAAVVLWALYLFPTDPFLYVRGLKLVNIDHHREYQAFLAGAFGRHFMSYYLVAWLLKTPIPILICVFMGLWFLFRSGEIAAMDRAFLVLPPLLIGGAYTLLSHNLGIRYLIPALPFLHLIGGVGLVRLARAGGVARVVAGIFCAWLAIGAAAIHPDQISYFNEAACLIREPARLGAAGGTACGPYWLDDSNVDWGGSLKQLDAWLQTNAPGRRIRLAYFGSISPSVYGIDHERIGVADLLSPPGPGLHVISAHMLARARGELARRHGNGPGNWFAHVEPRAVVAHAYYIYEIGATDRNQDAERSSS
ncbi:MAG: glycosyltransferase family 39 protein, partial [Acidobacteria bacterium]|nr:glycosyltransferase family 39 protein [Acidobacteriota bacterium]